MTDATHDAVEATADQAEKGARNISETADQLKKAVADHAGVAKEWTADRAGVARDWALDPSDVLRATVQTKPFITVGVSAASAFAAGLLVGIVLTRR